LKITNLIADNKYEKGFLLKDIGLFFNSPAVSGKDGQYVMDKWSGYGLGYNNRYLKGLTYIKNKWYEAETSKAKDMYAKKYRKKAKWLRGIIEHNLEKHGNLDLLKKEPEQTKNITEKKISGRTSHR